MVTVLDEKKMIKGFEAKKETINILQRIMRNWFENLAGRLWQLAIAQIYLR